jgi:hypothetical protein
LCVEIPRGGLFQKKKGVEWLADKTTVRSEKAEKLLLQGGMPERKVGKM